MDGRRVGDDIDDSNGAKEEEFPPPLEDALRLGDFGVDAVKEKVDILFDFSYVFDVFFVIVLYEIVKFLLMNGMAADEF